MPFGDSLGARMGINLDAVLDLWGETVTIVRGTGNLTALAYIDRPLPAQDVAPRAHEFDLVMAAGTPAGAPLRAGELVHDAAGAYYLVRVLRQSGPVTVGVLWRCNAVVTVYRAQETKDPVTGISAHNFAQAATGVRCRITMHPGTSPAQQEGQPIQAEARWVTQEAYTIAAAAGVLQAGDEVEAPGWPRLKAGRTAGGDTDDPSWEVLATPVVLRGVPGQEV